MFATIFRGLITDVELQKACVYPIITVGGGSYQGQCDQALNNAQAAVNNQAIWDKWRQKVTTIRQKLLTTTGKLYITGYARFFSPDIVEGDVCDNTYFLDLPVVGNKLKMKAANRRRMNTLVESVNTKIIATLQGFGNAIYVDIDDNFRGRRFCEKTHSSDPIGRGEHAHNVWFNDLRTQLDETREWKPASNNLDVIEWDEWGAALPGSVVDEPNFGRGITDKYQRSSSFHPKAAAYQQTEAWINYLIIRSSRGKEV